MVESFFLSFICVASCSTHSRSTFPPAANLVPEVAPFRNRRTIFFTPPEIFNTFPLFFLLLFPQTQSKHTRTDFAHRSNLCVKSGILVPRKASHLSKLPARPPANYSWNQTPRTIILTTATPPNSETSIIFRLFFLGPSEPFLRLLPGFCWILTRDDDDFSSDDSGL